MAAALADRSCDGAADARECLASSPQDDVRATRPRERHYVPDDSRSNGSRRAAATAWREELRGCSAAAFVFATAAAQTWLIAADLQARTDWH